MLRSILIIFLIIHSCSFKNKQSISAIEAIKAGKYTFSFKRQTEKQNIITSSIGHVYRNEDTCYLKQENLVNIQTDSIFISIDMGLKMAFASLSKEMKANLGILSLDPFNLINSADKFSISSEERTIDNKVVCYYFFDSSHPIKSFSYTYWKSKDSIDYFKVSAVYTQRLGSAYETILYKKNDSISFWEKPLSESDYIIKKESKLYLNSRLKDFIFSNYLKK